MAKPTIAITGANGFLGAELVKHFAKKNWQVIALVRNAERFKKHGKNVQYVEYDLAKPFNNSLLKKADYLVHTAYIKAERQHTDSFGLNIKGAERLLLASRQHGLKKNVFISSMSAHDDAVSIYGRQKLQIEKLFNQTSDVVLRPGLIIGNGGIVKNMVEFMKRRHVVPLVSGGKQPLQVIGIKDLVAGIEQALVVGRGVLTIAHPRVYTYKQFYRLLGKKLRIQVVFIPIPYLAVFGLLKTVSFLHIATGINTDNLRGLKKLRAANTAEDIKKLGLNPKSLDDCLDELTLGE